MSGPLFQLGHIVATPGAIQAMSEAQTNGHEFLARQVRGDGGDLSREDKRGSDLDERAFGFGACYD